MFNKTASVRKESNSPSLGCNKNLIVKCMRLPLCYVIVYACYLHRWWKIWNG